MGLALLLSFIILWKHNWIQKACTAPLVSWTFPYVNKYLSKTARQYPMHCTRLHKGTAHMYELRSKKPLSLRKVNNKTLDVVVSFDGPWGKEGLTSLEGVFIAIKVHSRCGLRCVAKSLAKVSPQTVTVWTLQLMISENEEQSNWLLENVIHFHGTWPTMKDEEPPVFWAGLISS